LKTSLVSYKQLGWLIDFALIFENQQIIRHTYMKLKFYQTNILKLYPKIQSQLLKCKEFLQLNLKINFIWCIIAIIINLYIAIVETNWWFRVEIYVSFSTILILGGETGIYEFITNFNPSFKDLYQGIYIAFVHHNK